MKKIILFALALISLASCSNKDKEKMNEEMNMQRDSLNQVIAQKDQEINDMLGTMNDIEEGFRLISEAEGRVTVAQAGEGASSTARIQENMEFIQNTMQQNRDLINKLRRQLRESKTGGEELKRTIENLTLQLETKNKELIELRQQLEAKNIHIAELDQTIAAMDQNISDLQDDNSRKNETINTQDKQLNTAWYVFGTKKELKEQNILKGGEVLRDNFNKDYFTKIDIRVDKEIKLFSRDAELLTDHPADSYTLTRDAKKQYILRITNPTKFWSTSKYLVIQVK